MLPLARLVHAFPVELFGNREVPFTKVRRNALTITIPHPRLLVFVLLAALAGFSAVRVIADDAFDPKSGITGALAGPGSGGREIPELADADLATAEQIAAAHERVASAYASASANAERWPTYVPVVVDDRCPHGTPELSQPPGGQMLRDMAVRGPVQAPSAYQLKVFVMPDEDAATLLGEEPYLRMKYEQTCDERGGSCATTSVALFISAKDTSNDPLVFDVITDGLGFRQHLKYPTGHPDSDDRQTK